MMGQRNNHKALDVLLADDSDTALHKLKKLVEELGHKATAVVSGEQALAASRAKAFDVILCDLVMPEIDGLEVLGKLKAYQPDTPILIFTGHGSMDTAIRALRSGADDYLTKPIEKELLALRINAVMDARQARDHRTERDQFKAAIATAGAAAHEINQPLMALMAASELITMSDDPQKVKELATVIIDQAKRLGDITWRLSHIKKYCTTEYTNGREILDLVSAAPYADDHS